jgi:site-specific recombinase XerD
LQYKGKSAVQSLAIKFGNYKHNYNNNDFTLVLSRQSKACPVEAYLDYIKLRSSSKGPIFIKENGIPISRSEFTSILTSTLKFCKLDPDMYKGHSFRIGAATHAAEQDKTLR